MSTPAVFGELVSNLGTTPGNQWSLSSFDVAVAFTTGSSESSYLVNKLTIGAASYNTGTSLSFFIYSDATGIPGVVLSGTAFTMTTDKNSYSYSELSAQNGSYTLAANTKYWLVADNSSGGGTFNWANAQMSTMVESGWDIDVDPAYRSIDSTTWGIHAGASAPLFSMETVPEPASAMLIATTSLAGLLIRRRLLS
jgi:hypothetical protein